MKGFERKEIQLPRQDNRSWNYNCFNKKNARYDTRAIIRESRNKQNLFEFYRSSGDCPFLFARSSLFFSGRTRCQSRRFIKLCRLSRKNTEFEIDARKYPSVTHKARQLPSVLTFVNKKGAFSLVSAETQASTKVVRGGGKAKL